MKKTLFSLGFLLSINGLFATEAVTGAALDDDGQAVQIDANDVDAVVTLELARLEAASGVVANAMRDEAELDGDDTGARWCMSFGRTRRRIQRCREKLENATLWAKDKLRNQYKTCTQRCCVHVANAKVWALEKIYNAYGVSRDQLRKAYAEVCIVAKDHPALLAMSVVGSVATAGVVVYLLAYNAAGNIIARSSPIIACPADSVCLVHQVVFSIPNRAQEYGALIESLKGLGVNYSFHIDFADLGA